MLLVAANLQAFFPMRPQLLSFALFGRRWSASIGALPTGTIRDVPIFDG